MSITGNSMYSNGLRSPSSSSQDQDLSPSDHSVSYERLMSVLRELGFVDFQRESIYQIPASKNPQDLNLFAKLSQYFDGKHHIEHIMYKEKVKRSQILATIDKFRDVLITCQHEDKTVFQLCPYLCE